MCHYTKTSAGFNVTNIGIKAFGNESGIDLFPNPAQSGINVKFTKSLSYQVKIYSALGELVFNNSVNATANLVYPIRLSLRPGAYSVSIIENGKQQVYTQKLIIVE
jgi:hypothetical protein